MCSEGSCICSKIKGSFEGGDGTTQGSCSLRSQKCQADGNCAECNTSGQCNGLTDTCENHRCVCGTTGSACNETLSNHCLNGVCLCGSISQCSQNQELITLSYTGNNGVDITPNCDQDLCYKICGCYWDSNAMTCKMQRTKNEVCQKITKYYNPLYIQDKLKYYYGAEGTDFVPILECDDVVGGKEGEYYCLGMVILSIYVS